jgi:hypothetical protein
LVTAQARYGTTLNNLFYTTPNRTTKLAKILYTCNSRCTEEVTNAELFSLLEIYMNDKLKGIEKAFSDTTDSLAKKVRKTENRTTKPAKILYTCTCITTLKIHKYIYIVNY